MINYSLYLSNSRFIIDGRLEGFCFGTLRVEYSRKLDDTLGVAVGTCLRNA